MLVSTNADQRRYGGIQAVASQFGIQQLWWSGYDENDQSYASLMRDIGNKTRELQVTSDAQNALAMQTQESQQALSGVNLDEEASNLLRYQQAYQAAGKVMQIASQLFDVLLTIGH